MIFRFLRSQEWGTCREEGTGRTLWVYLGPRGPPQGPLVSPGNPGDLCCQRSCGLGGLDQASKTTQRLLKAYQKAFEKGAPMGARGSPEESQGRGTQGSLGAPWLSLSRPPKWS